MLAHGNLDSIYFEQVWCRLIQPSPSYQCDTKRMQTDRQTDGFSALLGWAWASHTLARSFVGSSFYANKWQKWTWCLTSSCVTWKLSVVSEIYYIWSLDHQCHGKHVTKFSWMAIYGHWIVSVMEGWDEVFLNGHIWLLDCQCNGKHVTRFSWVAIYGHWVVSVKE